MGNRDITVNIADGVFNYRVGAIIIDNGEILMVKNDGAPFYYTVGGRMQLGESTSEAVIREVFEETQLRLEIDRLAYIHENFFAMNGDSIHEVCFFFLMKPHDGLRGMKHKSFVEEYGSAELHWLPVDGLAEYKLYPEFFKTELVKPVDEVRHFVTRECSH